MVEAKVAVDKSRTKFHSIFGPYFKVAMGILFPVSIQFEDIRIADTVTDEEIEKGNLKYTDRMGALHIYNPRKSESSADMSVTSAGELRFDPWVDASQAEEYYLTFRWKPQPQVEVTLGRFGEQESFGPHPGNVFTKLDYMSKAKKFIPLYIKIRDHKENTEKFFCLESKKRGILTIKAVKCEEIPPCLQ